MGMLDRDLRQVRATIIPNVTRETLQAQLLKHVKHGSSVFTDEGTCRSTLTSRCFGSITEVAAKSLSESPTRNGSVRCLGRS